MHRVRVSLDWLPNTNHTGFYVATSKGYYQELGLGVELLSPHLDDYAKTPAAKLASDQVDFAVAPSETIVSSHLRSVDTQSDHLPQAVAAIVQDDLSAIVTLASSGITRPSQLDGKTYASYGARFEGRIVQQLIKNDGGTGNFKEVTPRMLGIWETILKEEYDATWVFCGWEGIEAERKGIKLNTFKLAEAGIPYGYTPVLIASASMLRDHAKETKHFLAATAKGFEWAAEHPDEAAEILIRQVQQDFKDTPLPEPLDPDMVQQSQRLLSKHYLDGRGKWGTMDLKRCDAFLDWLSEAGLLTEGIASRTGGAVSLDDLRSGNAGKAIPRSHLVASRLFTNDYLAT
ncbi:hypothetical protein WJX73_006859 [Symbiochloris irregularis]|uniref:Thiamine pyrimidine synthase n=1 Tax=Symbiochloris irregularis TaxID=706552 RepID=A0AAW1P9X7_9CHLO